jgi:deoxyribodipyrimidine photo-lyase
VDPRVRLLNTKPVNAAAHYVLYWAQMNRRVQSNHALAHAVTLANSLKLPVLFYEGLTCSYPHANDRLQTFILQGVPGTARDLARLGIGYVFYLRKKRGDPDDVLYRLAANAAAIVADDYPTFVSRQFNARVPERVNVQYSVVDSSCVVPMSCIDKRQYAAYTIRPRIHRLLDGYLRPVDLPKIARRWKGSIPEFHTEVIPANIPALVSECQIDHSVVPSLSYDGGASAAHRHLSHFLEHGLRRYARDRNEPSKHATSGLSPYLHFGHISSLEVALRARDFAREHNLMADEFLEELIVRRELAFNFARFAENPWCLSNLPEWARDTLTKHAKDSRPVTYTRKQFEQAETHDDLWNATQKEMLLRGKIQGYYRMYWGKKIIEWSPTAQDALEVMVDLHDRYALDGRDPNTYTNILWCFGLHDRPWTERPIFGMVRFMGLDGMKRKTDTQSYIEEIERMERTGEDPFRL